jgi:hypothetical protein
MIRCCIVAQDTVIRHAGRVIIHPVPSVETLLLGAFLVIVPVLLAAAAYAFMWCVLCLVRFIPLMGRKHRHSDWDRLNR